MEDAYATLFIIAVIAVSVIIAVWFPLSDSKDSEPKDSIDAEEILEKPEASDSSIELLQQIELNTRATEGYSRRTHFWARFVGSLFMVSFITAVIAGLAKGCN